MRSRPGAPTWRKLLIIAMAFVLFAACSRSDDDSEAESGGDDGAAPASAATGDWDEVLDAADEEGTLSLYASGGVVEPMVAAFQEAYPEIEVELLAAPTTDLSARLDAEFQSGNVAADALYFAFPAWEAAAGEDGRFAEPVGPASEGYPEEAVVNNAVHAGGDPYGLFWNTNLVTEVPDDLTWDAFVDPQYDGQVVFIEPVSPIIGTLIAFQETENPGNGFFSEQIAGLNPQIVAAGAANHQAVAAGEAAWSPHGISSFAAGLVDEGAPVEFEVPDGPVFSIEYSAMALAEAPHPNAALVFVDWMMSEEGQQVLVDNGQIISYRAAGNSDFTPEGALDVTFDDIRTAGPDDPDAETQTMVDGILTEVQG